MARTRNLFDPSSDKPYRLSRSRLENFLRCPRCFYLDRRLGVDVPSGPPFSINIAVDTLLKREFDGYREIGEPHPYMVEAGIEALPAQHPQLDEWRENFKGVKFLHESANIEVQGAIDDLWLGADGLYVVADYKATAKKDEVNLDAEWQISYKRQMEIYQWLLRRNGLKVSDRSWFVYCNGCVEAESFQKRVDFRVSMLPYDGDDSWVEPAIIEAANTLRLDRIPEGADNCKLCTYRRDAIRVETRLH